MSLQRIQLKTRPARGFTLIELLVVMAIIATLAAVAMPVFKKVMLQAKMNAAMQSARQIGIGLQAYAADNGGLFPRDENSYGETITTSNDAFRDLVPDYIDDEKVFVVPGSAWGARVDHRIDSPQEAVQAGENHFAYISGLSSTSRSSWPLVVDGTDGSGRYTDDEGARGGVWQGKRAIVIRVDLRAEVVRLKGTGEGGRYIPRLGEESANALDVGSYMPEGAVLLDPAG